MHVAEGELFHCPGRNLRRPLREVDEMSQGIFRVSCTNENTTQTKARPQDTKELLSCFIFIHYNTILQYYTNTISSNGSIPSSVSCCCSGEYGSPMALLESEMSTSPSAPFHD